MSAPAPPPMPALPLPRALAYLAAAAMLAVTQGLGQGFVTANLPAYAAELGVSTTQAAWLVVAYTIPRAALPLMLIKLRTQYGLRRFAIWGIVAQVLVAIAALGITDLRSAIVVQLLAGSAAATLSTLAFLYTLEPLSPSWKMRLGLPFSLALMMSGPSLARVVSPSLIGDGGLGWLHLTSLALALISLALVWLLPLRPVPHHKVIQPLDLLSFGLIGLGFGGLIAAFVMGPLHVWTDAPWIGGLLALAVAALALAVAIELNRSAPILDIRWLVSPAMLHLTATLLLFRLILSEQSSGAPRMFQSLGVAPEQMTGLFAVIVAASLLGGLACVAWMRPDRIAPFHLTALALIMAGAWMDSHASPDTRPAQMLVSQAMIAFAAMLFMVPAMMTGLIAALARGPQYLLSFVIVFISTQSLGGVMGSGLFSTLVTHRQAVHLQDLTAQLQPTDPATAAALAARAGALASQLPDAALRQTQAVTGLVSEASRQAMVMAYDDAYRLTFLLAAMAAGALLLHLLRDRLAPLPATSAPS